MKLSRWTVPAALLLFAASFISCFQGNDVKIGVIIPQEGSSLQNYGFQITSGIELALADVKKNGVAKKNYTLIIKNEQEGDVNGVVTAFEELKKEGVTAVIGAASSSATLALSPLANESEIVLLSPAASSPEINSDPAPDFVFRNQPSDTLEAQFVSNIVFQKCSLKKVLVARAESKYAEGIAYEFLRNGRSDTQNQIPGEVLKFDSDPAKVDFVAVVDRMVELAPDAVFLAAYSVELVPLIREIRSREEMKEVYLFTSSALLPESAVTALGPEAMENVMFPSYPWDINDQDPRIQSFVQRFESEYHTKPDILAANGYDALTILVTAIDDVKHWMGSEVRDQINKEMFSHTRTNDDGTSVDPRVSDQLLRDTDFNKKGDVTRIPMMYQVVNGVRVKMTPEDYAKIKEFILTRI